ncbi:unnamed protein product [Meloidogyne enterolobii]|uniref:Uncharacterized protein n=1 Tax=Meloidogyne enterolobii TaxID=390850 RepID=A0ACB1AK61_MELEN
MYNEAVANNNTHCPVCLEEFTKEEIIVKTKCNHYFHWDCISKYFEEGRGNFGKCPICRGELDLDDNEDAVELNNKLKIVDLEFKERYAFRQV